MDSRTHASAPTARNPVQAEAQLPHPHPTDAAASDQDVRIDWSSIEEVTSQVSRATLAGMQQLWRQHAGTMDTEGKSFAQRVYGLHSQAMKEVASMKTFDLKPVISLLNSFTAGIRETVLEVFQHMRRQDDEFSQQIYQATRRNFTHNLKEALEARDTWYLEKIKGLKALHEATLAAARSSAAVELKQLVVQHDAELKRAVARAQKRKLNHAAKAAILAAATAAATATGSSQDPASTIEELMRSITGPAGDDSDSEDDLDLAKELAGSLKRLPADSRNADAALAETKALVQQLQDKVDHLSIMLQAESEEVTTWRSKWAQESTKTDGIKRECLQIITKCEDHVRALQQRHLAELSQRDYILQRCKDTILNLEAKVSDLSGAAPSEMVDVQHLLGVQRPGSTASSAATAGPRGASGGSLYGTPPSAPPQQQQQQQQQAGQEPGWADGNEAEEEDEDEEDGSEGG